MLDTDKLKNKLKSHHYLDFNLRFVQRLSVSLYMHVFVLTLSRLFLNKNLQRHIGEGFYRPDAPRTLTESAHLCNMHLAIILPITASLGNNCCSSAPRVAVVSVARIKKKGPEVADRSIARFLSMSRRETVATQQLQHLVLSTTRQ